MNPALFIHTAAITRQAGTITARERAESWPSHIASLKCRIEPKAGKDRESALGRIGSQVYVMSWGTADVRDGDRVTWNSKTFDVREVLQDTGRATLKFQTATLIEVKR